jgi:hypothetical protein
MIPSLNSLTVHVFLMVSLLFKFSHAMDLMHPHVHSSRRGRIYTPGSLPPPRSSSSPTPDAAAAAAALVATPQLDAASFEAQSRMQEMANAAAVAAAVEAHGILPPLSETTQSDSGATNSAANSFNANNTNKDSGLSYSRPQTLVLREEDEEEWLSPTKPAPPPSLFEHEDKERSSINTVAEAHRVVDLYHVDSRVSGVSQLHFLDWCKMVVLFESLVSSLEYNLNSPGSCTNSFPYFLFASTRSLFFFLRSYFLLIAL